MKEEIIEQLFNLMKPTFLVGIPEEYIDETLSSYYSDLLSRYGKSFDSLNQKGLLPEKILGIFLKSESSFLNQISSNQKTSIYVKDDALEKIYFLSMRAYNIAISCFSSKTLFENKDELDKLSDDILDNSDKVKSHNRGISSMLVSEGLLDIRYAMSGSKATSFRLASYIADQQEKPFFEEEREPK